MDAVLFVIKSEKPFRMKEGKKKIAKWKMWLGLTVALILLIAGINFYNRYVEQSVRKDFLNASKGTNSEQHATGTSPSVEESEADYERSTQENQNGQKSNLGSTENDYSLFEDDNVSVDLLNKKFRDFIYNHELIPYSQNSNYTFTLDYEAPIIDFARDWEPNNIKTGIQRKYFAGTELVAVERSINNSITLLETHLHPNGEIFSVKSFENNRPNGSCKFVDLEKHIVLEGNYEIGKLVGFWNTPDMAGFDMSDPKLRNEYPGVIDKTISIIKWYQLSKVERNQYQH